MVIIMGIIWDIISELSNEKNNKEKEDLEKEMDYYGLDEHERELVRKGDYEPYNFEDDEEEELDEDDYYYDK